MVLHVETITPTQQKAIDAHRRLVARIVERAQQDSELKCVSASVRTVEFKAPAPLPRPVPKRSSPTDEPTYPYPPLTIVIWTEGLVHSDGIKKRQIRVEDIQVATAYHYHVKPSDISSASRFKDIVWARQVAMFICKELTTQCSLPMIGRYFGKRDHTTILHGIRKIEKLRKIDKVLDRDIEMIERDLKERFALDHAEIEGS
jgi:hypothetical protein